MNIRVFTWMTVMINKTFVGTFVNMSDADIPLLCVKCVNRQMWRNSCSDSLAIPWSVYVTAGKSQV